MIYLYLKTHNQTNLNYLGKTTKNPFEYKGSGKYWLRHIEKHGYDVTTIILYETPYEEELKEQGLYYSNLWNIVESRDFANLVEETGTGGNNPTSKTKQAKEKRLRTLKQNNIKWNVSEEGKERHSIAAKNYWSSNKANEVRDKRYKGSHKEFMDLFVGPPKPISPIILNKTKIKCPHCNKTGNLPNMKRWHFDNCKSRPK